MSQLRERYHFIHNVFASFFKDALDFFSTCIYDRFQYRVVGTYDKAVEYINKQCEYGRETDRPNLLALILNPSGEFLPADANAGGRQYWRYPNLAPTMIKRLFDAIYKDEHLEVNAGFLRIFPFDYILYYKQSPEYDLFSKHPDLEQMIHRDYKLVEQSGRLILYRRKDIQLNDEQRQILEAMPK